MKKFWNWMMGFSRRRKEQRDQDFAYIKQELNKGRFPHEMFMD